MIHSDEAVAAGNATPRTSGWVRSRPDGLRHQRGHRMVEEAFLGGSSLPTRRPCDLRTSPPAPSFQPVLRSLHEPGEPQSGLWSLALPGVDALICRSAEDPLLAGFAEIDRSASGTSLHHFRSVWPRSGPLCADGRRRDLRSPVLRGTVAMPAVRGKQPAYVDMAGCTWSGFAVVDSVVPAAIGCQSGGRCSSRRGFEFAGRRL